MPKRSNDRSHLCAFTFVDGRHCRMPRTNDHLYLCAFHARKEAQAVAGRKAANDISYHLSGAFLSASDLSLALGRLFTATAQGQVKPKTAATLAYLGHTLLQTLRIAQHEYIQSFGADNWREAVRENHNQSYDYIHPPAEVPQTAEQSEPDQPEASHPHSPAPNAATPASSSPTRNSADQEEPLQPSESELVSK